MRNTSLSIFIACAIMAQATDYTPVSVHDPSVIRTTDGTYYIIGSHMAGAKTTDLMRWTQLGRSASNQPYFNNITTQLQEALTWGETNTFWAADYVQLPNGKWIMYYCVCEGSKPQGAVGYAVADSPEGKFTNLGILRRSNGNGGKYDPGDGSSISFNISNMPNCVDPTVFYDKTDRLWMVYGSYSGGIFILEMDKETGGILPKEQQITEIKNAWPYGKRLTGGGCSLEAAYIMYSPETDYYYMFISMGGLGQADGYNLRVARCKTPYGDYKDEKGQSMVGASGNDNTMYNYGLKIMGNHRFAATTGEINNSGIADASYPNYMSPGHNSCYYDFLSNRYFNVFHTRLNNTGEGHSVKVHPFEMSSTGWPLTAPLPYSGEVTPIISMEDVAGEYQFLSLGTGVSKAVINSSTITLLPDGKTSNNATDTWKITSYAKNSVQMRISGKVYNGCFFYQFNPRTKTYQWTFALVGGSTNATVWGIKTLFPDQANVPPIEPEADYVLMNAKSGHVLQAAIDIDAVATQQLYDLTAKQSFRIHYNTTNDAWQFQSASSDYRHAIGFRRNLTTGTVPIATFAAEDTLLTNATLFALLPNANGTYSIVKKHTPSRALHAASNDIALTISGTAANAASESQQWIFVKVGNAPIPDAIEKVPARASTNLLVERRYARSLHCTTTEYSSIAVYDVAGRMIASRAGTEVDIHLQSSGIYIVVATTAAGRREVVKVAL